MAGSCEGRSRVVRGMYCSATCYLLLLNGLTAQRTAEVRYPVMEVPWCAGRGVISANGRSEQGVANRANEYGAGWVSASHGTLKIFHAVGGRVAESAVLYRICIAGGKVMFLGRAGAQVTTSCEPHGATDPRATQSTQDQDPRREADGATRRLRQHRTCHGRRLVGRGRHSVDDSSPAASAGRGRGRGRGRGMRHEARGMRCDMRQTVDMTSQGDMFWKSHKGSATWPARTSAVHASETSCASPRPAADPFTSQEPRARRRYTGGCTPWAHLAQVALGALDALFFSPGQGRAGKATTRGGGQDGGSLLLLHYTTS
ncbi:hypothetical protein COCCADRAFT_31170 [Bipolaris zeicola 26-R-13]|uniref:Uncharacterized protein n=1 Tax=Cochliobolus carbonum (strain 26-R-13) TaxID=930089 RepID=W6XPY5_COCC2|nr:uncharacterized protein COCCADRAFT_31170 [Bipolaris zeicola 26-R-13]EUC27325.1 hypothetical protein COCCADRAFT_31170 [Bipolaris zeicola 26-R-13]